MSAADRVSGGDCGAFISPSVNYHPSAHVASISCLVVAVKSHSFAEHKANR